MCNTDGVKQEYGLIQLINRTAENTWKTMGPRQRPQNLTTHRFAEEQHVLHRDYHFKNQNYVYWN